MIATRIIAGTAAAGLLAAGLTLTTSADAASKSALGPSRCFDVAKLVKGLTELKDQRNSTVEAFVLGQIVDRSKRAEMKKLFDAAQVATGGDQEKMVRRLIPEMAALCPELKPLAKFAMTR